MYYGHIQSDNIVIQNIRRSEKGFVVSILFSSSEIVKEKSLTEMYTMLSRIPNYKIVGSLYNILPIVSPKRFVETINLDIRNGKCSVQE